MKDAKEVGPNGETIEARMQSLSKKAADDIKACANECDMYNKKRLLVKVLKGQVWEGKLVEWVETFAKRKNDFELALTLHTARAVDATQKAVEALDAKQVSYFPEMSLSRGLMIPQVGRAWSHAVGDVQTNGSF